jgi:hypothetical protein
LSFVLGHLSLPCAAASITLWLFQRGGSPVLTDPVGRK